MNPHRLAPWGFIYNFPVAALVGATTIVAYLIHRESKRLPMYFATVVWLLFVVWANITTVFALNDAIAMEEWERFIKIQLMAFLTLAMLTSAKRIDLLVWVIVLSIGFYGVKGGLFTLRTGGNHLLWGPPGSFIRGNNEIAFAILVTLPLIRYLQLHNSNRAMRNALGICLLLCMIAVLGSYSRGAFLTIIAILAFLCIKSRRRWLFGGVAVLVAIAGIAFMPADWGARMETIQDYDEDASAMGRINAWQFAINLANDRPLLGGGFRTFTPDLFTIYAPDPRSFHDAHSIYFEILAEHGYVGFTLFIMLGFAIWRCNSTVIAHARENLDIQPRGDLAAMLQVSLVGYGVGGAFLGLAYFDLLYHLVAISIANRVLAEHAINNGTEGEPTTIRAALRPGSTALQGNTSNRTVR